MEPSTHKTLYLVTYEMSEMPNAVDNTEWVFEKLKELGEVNRFQRRACLVYTNKDAKEIRDYIKTGIDCYDKMFVAALTESWAGWRTKLRDWIGPRRKESNGSLTDGAPTGSKPSVPPPDPPQP